MACQTEFILYQFQKSCVGCMFASMLNSKCWLLPVKLCRGFKTTSLKDCDPPYKPARHFLSDLCTLLVDANLVGTKGSSLRSWNLLPKEAHLAPNLPAFKYQAKTSLCVSLLYAPKGESNLNFLLVLSVGAGLEAEDWRCRFNLFFLVWSM